MKNFDDYHSYVGKISAIIEDFDHSDMMSLGILMQMLMVPSSTNGTPYVKMLA